MNKKTVINVVLSLIFVLVFNVIFFIWGKSGRVASQWLGYAFVHISYAVLLAATFLWRKPQSPEMNLPVCATAFAYFIVDLLVSAVFIVTAPKGIKLELVVQLLLLAVFAAALLVQRRANEDTAEQDELRNIEREYVREGSSRLKGLMGQTADRNAYRKIERAYDLIQSSPVKSSDSVMEQELEVIRLIGKLERKMAEENKEECEQILDQIMAAAGTRNRLLKAGR